MSASIVNKEHLDAILSWSLQNTQKFGLHWFLYSSGSNRKTYAELRKTLTRESVNETGQMLWKQNHISVNYRYKEHTKTPVYKFHEYPRRLSPVELLKALNHYKYQACENPGWKKSEAKGFCEALKEEAIRQLPGYETAEWERWPAPPLGIAWPDSLTD